MQGTLPIVGDDAAASIDAAEALPARLDVERAQLDELALKAGSRKSGLDCLIRVASSRRNRAAAGGRRRRAWRGNRAARWAGRNARRG